MKGGERIGTLSSSRLDHPLRMSISPQTIESAARRLHSQMSSSSTNEYGQGVPRNSVEAVNWYRKVADQHHAVAQFSLGIMYANGEGVPRSESEAAQWYRLAADQGLGGAQFNLAIMYAEGKGVPQDHVLAHMWLDIVVSELPPLGKNQRNSTVDALHLIASNMSMEQLAEARQLAFEWMIEHRHRTQQKNLAATLR